VLESQMSWCGFQVEFISSTWSKWITICGYVLMEITGDPARLERGKRFVGEGLAGGSLKPIIARTFPLEEIVEAHRYLESNQQIGKIVVTV
jgi:NADPH:quinone reductase-like Zn-dependent oxidoreductase